MSRFLPGKSGYVAANGNRVCLESWDVDDSAEKLPTDSFCSSGVSTGLVGIETLKWNISGSWDFDASPVSGPPGFYPRDDLQLVLGLPVGGWTMPIALVLSAKCTCAVRDTVKIQASGENNGSFTRA